MRGILFLAWRYVWGHPVKSAVLIMSLTLTALLPLVVHWLTGRFQQELVARAADTPLILGSKGSRYDLVLHSLYFEGRAPENLAMRDGSEIDKSGLATAIPIHARHHAKGAPVVGTSLDYFEWRRLTVAEGQMIARLGDCVVGANVADRLGLTSGDRLISDSTNPFNLAGHYPLSMRVMGVLDRSHSPDDDAVFVDIKTAWIMEGIGHGHQDVAGADPSLMLESQDQKRVASAALPQYTEITDENLDSFHFHGDPATFPATAFLVMPKDEKSSILLAGRYLDPEATLQILRPLEIVEELLAFVVRIKSFFDAQSLIVALSTLLLLGLLAVLSIRMRQREMETMMKIGASFGTIALLHVAEWGLIFLASGVLLAILTSVSMSYLPSLVRMLLF